MLPLPTKDLQSTYANLNANGWAPTLTFDWGKRDDGGFLTRDHAESGRYIDRAPTNRKAKRQRCKARRRARLRGRDMLTGSFIDDVSTS